MESKIIPVQFFNGYGNYYGLRFQDVQRGCAFRNIDGDCTHHDNELSEEPEPPCACDYCPLVETEIEDGDDTDYSEGEQPVRVVDQKQPRKAGVDVTDVAVLFARQDSIYKTIPGCDVWDIERDARQWPGGCQVVAHPPCRAWGRLRTFAKPRPDEKDLARWAVSQIRRWGGVLEHPESSSLWADQNLPRPGSDADDFGGWTLPVHQYWWGHRAQKKTWLYIVGCAPKNIPEVPMKLGTADCRIRLDKRRADGSRIRKGDPDYQPLLGDAEREHTPEEFARWLVELARRCHQKTQAAA